MTRTGKPAHCPHCSLGAPDWRHKLWECPCQPRVSFDTVAVLGKGPEATARRGLPHTRAVLDLELVSALARFYVELVARKDRWQQKLA
eukprot:4620285-Amphidinium_carterae.2